MKQKYRCHKNSKMKLFERIDLISENVSKTLAEKAPERHGPCEILAGRSTQGATRTDPPASEPRIWM